MWIGLHYVKTMWTLQKDGQKKADDDVWRRSRGEIAEEEGCSERFFVGFDRGVRRYLFPTHSSEIEFDGLREFLYGVNTETRKLIKRSSRKGELKEKFDVREMSSISTLKVAWEHYPWGTYDEYWQEEMDETDFCERVTQTNKLELLKWAREEKNCEWDVWTIHAAAEQGNLEMVKYCVANECPIDNDACAFAAN